MNILAIDPGADRCGCADFSRSGKAGPDGMAVFTPHCCGTWECTPAELYRLLDGDSVKAKTDVVVCEEFRLRRKAALSLVGGTMTTVEVIGVLRNWCRQNQILFVLQPPSIKRPTAAQMRQRGIDSSAVRQKAGPHARDAELHGWRYIFDHEEQVIA